MAKQSGEFKFIGRIGNLVFYEAFGQMLVRTVGRSGSAKLKKDEEVYTYKKRTNEVFEAATLLVKPIYALLPKSEKKHGVFGKMIGIANVVLQRGGTEEEARVEVEKLIRLI